MRDGWPLLPIHLRLVHDLFRALSCLKKPIRIASRSETANEKPCGFRSVQEFAAYTVVIKAKASYEIVGIMELGEKTEASVSIANGRIFLRTLTRLICVGKK